RLAAVLGGVEAHAENVEQLVVGGVDADLAEVHRPRVDAVDPGPGFAGVGAFVDAAGLVALGALNGLAVFDLSAEARAVGPAGGRAAAAGTAAAATEHTGRGAELFEGDVERFLLLAAADGHLDLVADFLGAEGFEGAAEVFDLLAVDLDDEVVDLDAGL